MSNPRLLTPLAAALFLTSGAAIADGGDASDVRALERQLADEHAALSTTDCHAACRALASIRRAAEKICALEPGPRCEGARAKADEATRRVREACPDCVVAAAPAPEPAPEAVKADHEAVTRTAPAESRGGCRSCATTGGETDRSDLAIVAVAIAACLKRKKRAKR